MLLGALAGGSLLLVRGAPGRGEPIAGPDSGPNSGSATLVFAEFGAAADRVYTAPATDPAARELVATIQHAEGWGLNPAPQLSGTMLAYTVLPATGPPRRDAPAELWLLDVATRDRTRIARDADLLAVPHFDAAGEHLVYRSTDPTGAQTLVRVELASRLRRSVLTTSAGFGVYPVGFDHDGAIVFAALSTGGTDFYRVADGEEAQHLLHATDQIARDWRLSPDGRWLSFLAPEEQQERVVHRLHVADMDEGSELAGIATGAPPEMQLGEQVGPVWTPSGGALTIGREAYPGTRAGAITLTIDDEDDGGGSASALASPAAGFDVPLGWSPGGRYLAVRSFTGTTAYRPGLETMVIVGIDGRRQPVQTATELIFLGWLGSG